MDRSDGRGCASTKVLFERTPCGKLRLHWRGRSPARHYWWEVFMFWLFWQLVGVIVAIIIICSIIYAIFWAFLSGVGVVGYVGRMLVCLFVALRWLRFRLFPSTR